MEPKVYILNINSHDYSRATDFGEVIPVTLGIQPVFKIDILKDKVVQGLLDFKENDYIILSGPSVLVMLATSFLFARFNNINVLIHDATRDNYVHKIINKEVI